MSSLIFLIPIALLLGGVALGMFFWSLRSGQYDDLEGAGQRIFIDEASDRAGARHSSPAATAGASGALPKLDQDDGVKG